MNVALTVIGGVSTAVSIAATAVAEYRLSKTNPEAYRQFRSTQWIAGIGFLIGFVILFIVLLMLNRQTNTLERSVQQIQQQVTQLQQDQEYLQREIDRILYGRNHKRCDPVYYSTTSSDPNLSSSSPHSAPLYPPQGLYYC